MTFVIFLCGSLGTHPAMELPSCSSRPRPRLWLLRRNLAPAGEESCPVCVCCHSVAEAPPPGGAGTGQEWKIVSLRECPTPENMQQCEPPDQAAAYWKSHIASHPYFNSECECHRRRSALTREARVVGFISSNSAAPPGPKTLPPLFLSAAVMLSRSWRFQSSRVRTDAVSPGCSFV